MLSIRNKQNWLLSIFQLLMSFFAVDLKGLFRLYPLSLCHLILQRFQDLLRQLLSTLVHIFLNSTSSKDWKDFYQKSRHPYHLSNSLIRTRVENTILIISINITENRHLYLFNRSWWFICLLLVLDMWLKFLECSNRMLYISQLYGSISEGTIPRLFEPCKNIGLVILLCYWHCSISIQRGKVYVSAKAVW